MSAGVGALERRRVGLTRTELAGRTLLTLQRGGWGHPDVLLVEWPAGRAASSADGRAVGRAVVKDFAPRPAWVRWTFGRWLAAREARTYRALEGHPDVPRFLGRVDALAFAVEHRPGIPFSGRRRGTFDDAFAARLGEAVDGLHRRGVVHLDLSHRRNVRADLQGRPVLIDFGAALRFRPGGLGARWLLPVVARLDRRALRKWRRRIAHYADIDSGSGGGAGAASEGGRGDRRPT